MHVFQVHKLTMLLLWFLILATCFGSIQAQQYYDNSGCSENTNNPGSRYICNSHPKSCSTFLIYRASQNFNTISNVSRLFQRDAGDLLRLNSLSSPSETLDPDREVLIPVTCSCVGEFFQVKNFSYMVSENTTLPEIACSVFEGLVKANTIIKENPSQENGVNDGSKLDVPLRCACPDNFSITNGVKFLVTYPLIEGDSPSFLSLKFGISIIDLWAANHLEPLTTIFPNTTILIPLKNKHPAINLNLPNSPPPTPGFLPTVTVEKTTSIKLVSLYISVSVVGFFLIIAALIACGWYAKFLHKWKIDKLRSFNTRSSQLSCSTARSSPRSGTSCLSSDILVEIKYSLKYYSTDDLKKATKDFGTEAKIGDGTYKGLIDDVEMMIKQLRFEEIRQVIDVHSKINHKNIVNLVGVCYGDNEFSCSYLLFELPGNGSLRDCLSNPSASFLRWHYRTQIAFDIATGLHYLHYCIFPSYAHMNVNSRNIFITANWRAKLTIIRTNSTSEIASDYNVYSSSFNKVDIFAFGVVLLELLSGREDIDGKLVKDSIGFLRGGGGGGSDGGGCFEQLRSFIDPCLKEDYPLAEALCLAVLAKACVEDDPFHRPSMDDILKVLVRLV